MIVHIKKYYLILFLIFLFPVTIFSQENTDAESAGSSLAEGYKELDKLKKKAREIESMDETEVQEVTEDLPDGDEVIPETLYKMQRASEKPLYDPEGKRDPFKPFIQAPREEEVVVTEATPPLKKYDLDQYRITGIVWINNEPRAMVVDPEGNTYFLGAGDEIGNRNGEIIEVRENGLLVREKRYFEDVFGNRKVEVKNSVLAFMDEDG